MKELYHAKTFPSTPKKIDWSCIMMNEKGGGSRMMWGYPHMYMWGGSGFWGFPSLLSILFFIGIIILFFSLFRKSSSDEETDEEDSALDILKKRYARGEITKRQFVEMKKDIG